MTRRTDLSLEELIEISSADITTRITTIASATTDSLVDALDAIGGFDGSARDSAALDALAGMIADTLTERGAL